MTSRRGAVAALVAVIVAMSLARVVHVGDSEFWFDEYLHAFAARSLNDRGTPTLPSGIEYTRGLEFTRLVAIAQQHISDPETAARLPSAIMGIANVLIFAAIAWRVGGPWTAVWAALLLGIYPDAQLQARNARFYTEQLNLGLVAFWFGWLSIRDGPLAACTSTLRTWAYLGSAAIAFALAAQVQLTTWTVAFAYAAIVALAATVDIHALGRAALRRSPRVQAVLLGIAIGLIVLALRPSMVMAMWRVAFFVPAWAQGQYSPKAFYWMLSNWLPLVLAFLPVILIAVALRNVRLAAYLGLWFGIPLALHSFVFHFQAERFVLLAMPGLLLAAAIAAVTACGAGYTAVRTTLAQRGIDWRTASQVAALCVAVGAGSVIASSPGFTLARKFGGGALERRRTNWRGVGEVVRRVPGSDSIPWGTASPLASLFYWGRADFAVFTILLDGPDDIGRQPDRIGDSARDYYTGVPVVPTPAGIRDRFAAKGAVLIAVDSAFAIDRRATPLVATLRREAVDLCEFRCGEMRLFYWRFADSTRADVPEPFAGPAPPDAAGDVGSSPERAP